MYHGFKATSITQWEGRALHKCTDFRTINSLTVCSKTLQVQLVLPSFLQVFRIYLSTQHFKTKQVSSSTHKHFQQWKAGS